MNVSDLMEFFENNSDKIVTSVNDIGYIESDWDVNDAWCTKGKTKAWIDIVGYHGLIKYNDTFYIENSPPDDVYVLYDLGHTLYLGGENPKYIIKSLSSNLNKSFESGVLTATLSTTLLYKRRDATEIGFRYLLEPPDNQLFTTRDNAPPDIYPNITLQNYSIMVYNNTFAPKSIITLPKGDYILGYRVEFDNETIDYYHNILTVEENDNGFPYGNITPYESNPIYKDSDLFSRAGNNIILNCSNMTEINDSLKLYVITPYEEQQVNYSVVNGSTSTEVSKTTASGIFSVCILIFISVFLIKYLRNEGKF